MKKRNRKRSAKTRSTSRSNRTAHSQRLSLEPLEDRVLLASTPFALSSINTGAAQTPALGGAVFQGPTAGLPFGGPVGPLTGGGLAMGDVDGDGLQDMIVGVPYATPTTAGATGVGAAGAGGAYVVFGTSGGFTSPTNLATAPVAGVLTIDGAAAGDFAGRAVSAGDINGDGIADIVIGAPYSSPYGGGEGTVFVIFGGANLKGGGPIDLGNNASFPNGGLIINASDAGAGGAVSAGAQFGFSAHAGGDIDGDGFNDLVIGSPYSDPAANGSYYGSAHVVFGGAFPAGVTPIAFDLAGANAVNAAGLVNGGFTLNGFQANSQFGASVNAGSDINGDLQADIAVGAPNANPAGATEGAAYLLSGVSAGPGAAPVAANAVSTAGGAKYGLTTFNGFTAGSRVGNSVSLGGDVNGDGAADLLIGAPSNGPGAPAPATGNAYVIFGSSISLGAAVGAVSPVPGATVNLTNLSKNPATIPNGGLTINGFQNYSEVGYSVANNADINGDGIADMVIGARYASPTSPPGVLAYEGAAYVIFGGAALTANSTLNLANPAAIPTDAFAINGFQSNPTNNVYSQVGNTVALGDMTGDGFAEIATGAIYADVDGNGTYEGAAYVVFPRLDFGDAPASYEVNAAAVTDPGRHLIDGNRIALGSLVTRDAETAPISAAPGAPAIGDDTTVNDDEDGVTNSDGTAFGTQSFTPGTIANINVTATSASFLDAWVDFDGDGNWLDAGEQIFAGQPLAFGNNALTFAVPAAATPGTTYARFRNSSTGGLISTGFSPNGEIEDYDFAIGTSVMAPINTVAESPAATADFIFTRMGNLSNPSTINFTVGGSATFNTDYTQMGATVFTPTSGTVVIPALSSSSKVTITTVPDLVSDPNETIILGVPGSNSATVTILEAGAPAQSVVVAPSSVNEGGNLVYTFTGSANSTVNFNVSGTATPNTDYTVSGASSFTGATGSVAIPGGTTMANVTAATVVDAVSDSGETVIFTVAGTTSSATGTINDGGPGLVITATDANKNEGDAGPTNFTFNVSGGTAGTTANFAVTGTGANPANAADFVGNALPAGNVTTGNQIVIPVQGDTTVEPNETFNVTLSTPSSGVITTPTATGTIVNDDVAAGLPFNQNFDANSNGFDTTTGFVRTANPVGGSQAFQSPNSPTAVSTITAIGAPLPVAGVTVSASLTSTPENGSAQFSNAYVVFDYQNATNYKLVGKESKNGLWVVAQVVNGSYSRLTSVFDPALSSAANQTNNVVVEIRQTTVLLRDGGVQKISTTLGGNLLDGQLGVGAVKAISFFDNINVTTP